MERKQLDFDAPLISVRRNFSHKLLSTDQDVVNATTLQPNRRRNTMLSVRPNFNLDHLTKPVDVPFMWEHIPGRPKTKSGPILPSRPFHQPETDHHNLESNLSDWENDDAFSDALDTLSSVSFSRNSSVSSGSGGLDTKPSAGTFSQTRDFMLRRFLPAAQAMTLSHYLSKKQALTVSHDLSRDVKEMVIDENKLQVKKYDSGIMPSLEESKRYEESESEADYYNPSAVVPAKARGFLPRLRRSLCLLNPMPGMKFRRSQSFKTSLKGTPKAPSDEVRRPKKTVSGHLIHYTDEHTLDAINNHRFDYGVVKNHQRPFRQSYSGELPTTNMKPPLPRCPSESCTLPSRSTSPHARKVSQVTSCTKWENIVLFAAS